MSKFLVLYRAPVSVREQMESSTPDQRQAGMELWRTWAGKAASAIVDLGAPLGDGAIVGDGDAYNDVSGFSILDTVSQQAVIDPLCDHPHLPHARRTGQLEIHELQHPPGM